MSEQGKPQIKRMAIVMLRGDGGQHFDPTKVRWGMTVVVTPVDYLEDWFQKRQWGLSSRSRDEEGELEYIKDEPSYRELLEELEALVAESMQRTNY